MSDMLGYAGVGQAVLRRPSGAVRFGRTTIPTGAGKVTTLYEVNYAGMPLRNISANTTIDGLSYVLSLGGSGGSVDIVANGLKYTCPSAGTAEAHLFIAAGQLTPLITQARWRRGRIGVWSRVSAWAFPVNCFWYCPVVTGNAYPHWAFYNRRSRGSQNTNSDINGGWVGGGWFGGETGDVQANGGASSIDDVSLLYFRTPWDVWHLRGMWSNETGWPLMENMTFGGISPVYIGGPTRHDTGTGSVVASTLDQIGFYPAGGGQSNNNAVSITVDRFRVTSWE